MRNSFVSKLFITNFLVSVDYYWLKQWDLICSSLGRVCFRDTVAYDAQQAVFLWNTRLLSMKSIKRIEMLRLSLSIWTNFDGDLKNFHVDKGIPGLSIRTDDFWVNKWVFQNDVNQSLESDIVVWFCSTIQNMSRIRCIQNENNHSARNVLGY